MFTLSKTFRFEASHQLPLHDGKCARLHGHSWTMTVFVSGRDLHASGPQTDMVMDYGRIKQIAQPLVDDKLDHWHLNDSTGLANPTCERLAQWIYERLAPQLPDLVSIEVHETCTTGCQYRPDVSAEGAPR